MKLQEKIIIYLSIGLISIATLGYFLLPIILDKLNPPNQHFIGMAVDVKDDVKIRFGDSINWKTLSNNEKIFSNSYLYTGDNSSARFIFLDKSSITLNNNSLVHLNFEVPRDSLKKDDNNNNLKLDLVDGKAALDIKEDSVIKKVKIQDTEIEVLDGASKLNLENTEEFGVKTAVYSGSANISRQGQKYKVKAGEKVEVSEENKIEKKPVSEKEMAMMKKIHKEIEENKRYLYENRRSFMTIIEEMVEFFEKK